MRPELHAAFLRSPETQGWIGEFGKGKYDDRPLFFPVVVSPGPGPGRASALGKENAER